MLNFDPYRWIAEQQGDPGLAELATLAAVMPENENSVSGVTPAKVAKPANPDPRQTLRQWHGHLVRLDPMKPPAGMTAQRWRQLVEDSHFLYEGFASQLVREGWTTLDVFGVLDWRPGGAVLLDRLQGARNLKLDGEGRAFWSRYGVTFQTGLGIGDDLVSSGLKLIWEIGDE